MLERAAEEEGGGGGKSITICWDQTFSYVHPFHPLLITWNFLRNLSAVVIRRRQISEFHHGPAYYQLVADTKGRIPVPQKKP